MTTDTAQTGNHATVIEIAGSQNGTREEIIVTTDEEGMAVMTGGEGTGAETTDTEADTTTATTTAVTVRGSGMITAIKATVFETTATAVIVMESAAVLLGALLLLDALVRIPTQHLLHPRTRRNLTLPHRVCSQLRRTRSKILTERKLYSSTMSLLRLANPL
jgi:hypothetical protein